MDNVFYRQTRISVEEFNSIFGDDGNIAVYSPNGELIGNINKNSKEKNGEYVFIYPSMNYNNVKFELTNIKNDGSISIKNDKAIKDSSTFTRDQISLFSAINTVSNVNLYKGEEVKTYSAEGNITLEETESKMTINMDTTALSVENENEVAINVTLKTDEERYDLFENPSIDIEFPSAIENINIEEISLLYKNGLSIDRWDIITNSIGRKVLKVKLSGAQMEYTPGAVHEGTTLVIYTNLDVNRMTADSKDSIKMTYSNKDSVRLAYMLDGRDSEDTEVEFVGRQELVRSSKITELEVATATSYDDTTEKIKIPVDKEHEIVINNEIVNNYEATLDDVVVVGRIPFVGNKDGNGNDLGTNFDTYLKSAMTTSGVKGDIYYSEDGEADRDSESWTKDVTDFSKIKSYKLVIREKKLAKGERISFDFYLSVPSSVSYNSIAYTTYTVYYKIDNQEYSNQCSVGMETEQKEIDIDDIEDDKKEEFSELTVGTQVSQGGVVLGETDFVYERQVLKYTVVVKNTSDVEVNDVLVRFKAPNANIYDWEVETLENYDNYEIFQSKRMKEYTNEEMEYSEVSLAKLGAEESKTLEFQVIVKDLSEIETPEVYGEVTILKSNQEISKVQTFKNEIREAKVELLLSSASNESLNDMTFSSDSRFDVCLDVKSLSEEKLQNLDVIVNLTENLSLNEDFMSFSLLTGDKGEYIDNMVYDAQKTANGQVIIFSIPELNSGETIEIGFSCDTQKIEKSIYSQKFSIKSETTIEDEKYLSNEFTRRIYQSETELDFKWTANKETGSTLVDGEEVRFYLDVENNGVIDSLTVNSDFEVPDGLVIEEARYNDDGASEVFDIENDEEKFNTEFSLNTGKKTQIEIITKVNSKLFSLDQSKVEAKIDILYGNDEVDTPVLSYNIVNDNVSASAFEPSDKQEDDDPDDDGNTDDGDQTVDYGNIPGFGSGPKTSANSFNNYGDDNIEKIKSPNQSSNSQKQPNQTVTQVTDNKTPTEPTQNQSSTDDEDSDNSLYGYEVSGLAWIDKNQDGIRQADEEVKEAVIVTLYKANKNGGLDTENKIATTSTMDNGSYKFENVQNGSYIIVFDYNSSKYKVTRYQVETAKSDENSDVISKVLKIDGTSQVLGVTDVINIDNIGAMSVDIGLVDKTNFDLKLEKTISSVTIKNDEGTKVHNYNDVKNSKIEIRSKYYKSSVLDITYKFKVTNEGDIAGYVNKIVDYLPEDVQVVLNRSEGWYIGSDNGLYYNGLMEQEIKPGETKEFTLVLRKSLANGESVKLVNSAEIVEVTNNLGLLDRDSIENNKIENEDDFGTTDLIISVSTGHSIQYIVTTLIIIIMISVIMMMFIKIKNTKKIYR